MCVRRKKQINSASIAEVKTVTEKTKQKPDESPRKASRASQKKRSDGKRKRSKHSKQRKSRRKEKNDERPTGEAVKEAKKSKKNAKLQKQMMKNPFYQPERPDQKNPSKLVVKAPHWDSKSDAESNRKGSARDSSTENPKPRLLHLKPYTTDLSSSKSERKSKEPFQPNAVENDVDSDRDFAAHFMNESRKTETSTRAASSNAAKVEVVSPASEVPTSTSKPSQYVPSPLLTERSKQLDLEEQDGGCNLELNASHLAQFDKRRRRQQRPEDDTLYGIDPVMPEKDFSPVNTISDRTAFSTTSQKAAE